MLSVLFSCCKLQALSIRGHRIPCSFLFDLQRNNPCLQRVALPGCEMKFSDRGDEINPQTQDQLWNPRKRPRW